MTRAEACKINFTKHGAKAGGIVQPAYVSWGMMKNRCLNSNATDYRYYGGRGITVCDKWKTFEGFIEDMGYPPSEGMTIERIDSKGNYELTNCKWATRKEQSRNRDYCKQYTLNGISKYTWEWADYIGITPNCFRQRFRKKISNNLSDDWVLRII